MLVDLRDSHPDLTGEAAEDALADEGLVVDKNAADAADDEAVWERVSETVDRPYQAYPVYG